MERGKLAVVGALVDNDLIFAEHLSRYGHEVKILRRRCASDGEKFGGGGYSRFGDGHIIEYNGPLDLIRKVKQFDYIFTFTASFPFGLFYLLPFYPALTRIGWPQYMNIGTGSDLTERIIAGGLDGFLQRLGCKLAHVNMVLNYPHSLKNVARLRMRNTCILPFPYLPAASASGAQPASDRFVIFHPAHLDWGETDASAGRTSTKGNDRFIRAVARFRSASRQPISVIMLDRGSDRAPARRLVEDLGLADCVTWREHMMRDELFATVQSADLVVDQFDVGGLGGIAWESLSLGTPVMMHLAAINDSLSYDEPTPVLQARTENEILAGLHKAADPVWRAAQRRLIASWMAARDPKRIIPRYLVYASIATGKDFCGFWADHQLEGA